MITEKSTPMDALSYLHWLRTTDLDHARPQDLIEAVREVLQALDVENQESGEQDMAEALQAILEELKNGALPLELLREFRIEFDNDPSTYEPPEAVLEQELREIAEGIGPERWSTETYQNLENALQLFLDGGEEEGLWEVVDGIDALMESTYQAYAQTAVLPKEVTLESAVAHKLLCEGMGWWKEALESLREEEEPDWSAVLHMAENGNRLLIAVQIFNERVQRALSH